MQMLSLEELKALAEQREGWCVSLFVPMHRAGAETQQNAIRFKNLLSEAENQLAEKGLEPAAVEALLKPGHDLLENSPFWQHQLEGLAVFFTRDEPMRAYRVPLNLDELAVVADRFHTKPLLPLFSGDGQFYILALSQKAIRLLRGTRDSVSEIELEEVPQGIDEMLWFEDPERHLHLHISVGRPGGGDAGGHPAVFHGHGVSTETDDKEMILRYFHRVDKGIQAILSDEHAPLVLAGVEYLLPIYHEANSYPHILEKGITGNPETLRREELHTSAWDIVVPVFTEAQQQAAAQYQQLANTERASDELKEVITAAHHGRIDTLFVAVDQQKWGNYDITAGRLEIFPETAAPGGIDLLDLAATQTLLHDGDVYAVSSEDMPAESPIAAVFRY